MRALRRLSVDLRLPVAALAVLIALASVWYVRDDLPQIDGTTWFHLSLFMVTIALGETARLTVLTSRETAPMSTAAALGLSLSALPMPVGTEIGAAAVIVTICAGMLVGTTLLRIAGAPVGWADTAARVVGAAVAPVVYREIVFRGQTLMVWQSQWDQRRWLVGILMVLVGAVTMVVTLTLEAAVRAGRDHAPVLPAVADELRSTAGLASALVTSGALIALAEFAIGIAALPLFLFPLVLTYFAVRRFANIRTTYRQTIGALSSLTERAGYTGVDHAERVTRTSIAVGRDLGMGQRDLTDLEYAALLHDLGQVALREPIPHGATVMAAPADQQRIAHDGAEIVRSTGVLDTVAAIMEAQTTPYRQVREFGQDLPMASRIIKVANAYDDMSGPHGENDERAMERIHLGLGYEYDPQVVDALTRVLQRRRRATPPTVF
ncbi:HD-GYP domain-containing protein [Nostocoides sp. HKS02]|uniref:HD-GYP domain-containing protein n=1 Tax=Nostocoides sp. HKS02 TaxID=1813880 RepID=UPI0012B4A4C3|nr:HD domain-containing phosphohydrolase [Tetrasphaera sp. HKS02]QGN57967.1 HD domain-containing protein [Tetrasphaera sp. HKS02]